MALQRSQLNDLIFHNRTVLPRLSPGFGDVSLAVAELQGGNNEKAAILAEIAVGKDPHLAAGWLAKTAADVYEAAPDDLRKERAVFCMDRALDCAPSCRREIIEFFVANILNHYVEVLCEGAAEELGTWTESETQARTAELQAVELNSQASGLKMRSFQLQGDASVLEAAGLVTGLTALFSQRLGTQVLSGMATATALSEADRRKRDAALLNAQANAMRSVGTDLRQAGGELRQAAAQHRTASMLLLVPARDLIELAVQLLRAETLPGDTLLPLIDHLTDTLQRVLTANLTWLHQRALPVFGEHPESQTVVLGLTRILPWMKRGDLERMVARYQPAKPGGGKGLAMLGLLIGCFVEVSLVIVFCSFASDLFKHGGNGEHARGDALGGMLVFALAIFGLDRLRAACFRRVAKSSPGVNEGVANERELLRRGLIGEQVASLAESQNRASTPPPLPGSTNPPRFPAKRVLRLGVVFCRKFSGSIATVALGVALFCTTPPKSSVPASKPSGALASSTPDESPQPTAQPSATVRRALPVSASSPSTTLPASTPAATMVSYVVTGVAAGDSLNVRSGPGANHEVVARLPNGSREIQIVGAPVLNGPTPWVQIKFGERTGWVTRPYLRPE